MRIPKTKLLVMGVAASIALAACGTSAASQPATTTTSSGHDHDMSSMNMGDADALAAYDVSRAEISDGLFLPLPDAQSEASGYAWLARHDKGTTVTIELDGLDASTDHIAHVHAGACVDGGGPHYKFDPAGDHHPPNEIHLAFTSTAEGVGSVTANNGTVAGVEAASVVVHVQAEGAPKLVCTDLTP